MNKINNKSNYLKLIIGIFLVCLFVVGGTFAYYIWNSTENKLVLVNTSKELSEYIIYDEGESKFVGDFQVGDSYLDGMYTTISIYKTEEVADLDLYATINMDINAIGDNISDSSAVKWTLTKGNSTNPTEILASGNFLDAVSGESFPLHSNIEVTTTLEEYTIWLWIDASENPSSELTGETLDTLIWTQVEQLVNDRFEITRLNNKTGKINATVVNPQNNITSYQVTTSSDEPTEWVTINDAEQGNEYLLEYPILTPGTYYVWFKDETGEIVSKSIEALLTDITPPTGTLSISGDISSLTATISAEDNAGINSLYGWKVMTSRTCDRTVTDFTETETPTYNFSVNSNDMYYLCCRFEDVSGNYGYASKVIENTSKNYVYTGNYETFTAPESGYYKIEAWGASGGSSNNEGFGLGAYTSGIIELNKGEEINIYVGSQGSVTSSGAVKTGGGATDIRLVSGTSAEALNSRIMVAAGGGSVTSYTDGAQAGNGGTLIGEDGVAHTSVASAGDYIGYKATQTYGGAIGSSATSGTAGGFGYGGTGGVGPGDPEHIGSNGGSGYYGGGGSAWHAGSGGGSSFISGYSGVNAITSSSNRTHTNNTLHYSDKYFIDGEMQGGVNSGNGKAIITYIGNNKPGRVNQKLDNVKYIKDCTRGNNLYGSNQWSEIQAIKNGMNVAKNREISLTSTPRSEHGATDINLILDGKISEGTYWVDLVDGYQCATVDLGQSYDLDEIAVWHYYADGRTYNDNITYVSSDGSNWEYAITKYEAETVNGKRVSAYDEDTTDENAPTGTLSATLSGNTVTATFSNASDNGGTGIKEYQYLITTDSTCPTTGYTSSVNSTYIFTVSSTGTYYVCARIKDNVGNISVPLTYYISVIDDVAPTGVLSVSKSGTTITASFSSVVEEISGIKEYQYLIQTSSSCPSSGYTSSTSTSHSFTGKSVGSYYVCARIVDNAGNISYAYYSNIIIPPDVSTYTSSGAYTYTAPISGYYKVEAWGAQGGTISTSGNGTHYGGYGSYTSGYVYLSANESIYVYVGAQGGVSTSGRGSVAFNGGGSGYGVNSTYPGASGGGATDIRTVGGNWDNATSLNSRIMVAAGGGGAVYYQYDGAAGGTINGISGANATGGYGKQSSAGAASTSPTYDGTSGGFGYGGNSGTEAVPGGGSGYYGAAGEGWTKGLINSASSGSSFISGYSGVNAITSASSRTHTNNTNHYSGKYFVNGYMQGGVNSGNGKASITYFGNSKPLRVNTRLNNVRYIKDCINGSSANTGNHWVEIQAIYNGTNIAKGKTVSGVSTNSPYIVDGKVDDSSQYASSSNSGNVCAIIDLGDTYNLDEIAVWHYYADGRKYNSNITYVSSNNSTWTEVINSNTVETVNGKRVNAYTVDSGVQEVKYLFKNNGGAQVTWNVSNQNTGNGIASVNSDRIEFYHGSWASGGTGYMAVSTGYMDLSKYKTANFEINITKVAAINPWVGVSSGQVLYNTNAWISVQEVKTYHQTIVVSVDISSISNGYVGIRHEGNATVTNVWLEG